MEELKPQSQNTLTLYQKDGAIVGVIPLNISGTSHKTRCLLAHDLCNKNWHHYTMHNTAEGMKKWDTWMIPLIGKLFNPNWYLIDLSSGKITKRI